MPVNEFNIGRDVTLDIADPARGPQRFTIKTGWQATPIFDQLKSKGLDGEPRHDAIPDGWRLRMDLDRADPRLDNFFADREAAYFNDEVVPLISITETVREVGGGRSIYRYTKVSPTPGETTWRGNQITTQQIEFMASHRIKVA